MPHVETGQEGRRSTASRSDFTPAAELSLSKPAGRRILIMDDEHLVREFIIEALRHLGHAATGAADGSEAVALYEQAMGSGRPFDGVMMDLIVPGGMGGVRAIKKLRLLDPKVRAIVSSGERCDPILSDYDKFGFCGVILKPYNLSVLKAAMSRLLDG